MIKTVFQKILLLDYSFSPKFIELEFYFDHENSIFFQTIVDNKCLTLLDSSSFLLLGNNLISILRHLNYLIPVFELIGLIGTLWSFLIIKYSKHLCFTKTKHFYFSIFISDLIAINGWDKSFLYFLDTSIMSTLVRKLTGYTAIA